MNQLRKGARVETSGEGRTATWSHGTATVTKVRGDLVYVVWDGTHFEDEMSRAEVRLIDGRGTASEGWSLQLVTPTEEGTQS